MNENVLKSAYEKFVSALNYCLDVNDDLTQVKISVDAGVSESYVSQVANGLKSPGFKTQVRIAHACGYEYTEFMTLLDPSSKASAIHFESEIERSWFFMLREFLDVGTGQEFTQLLLQLERDCPGKYYALFGEIKGLIIEKERARLALESKDCIERSPARNGSTGEILHGHRESG